MNQNLELLSNALVYIEEHLHEKICTEDIAQACYCSKSTLEKIFRCINDITVRDYLIRRRMTKAARELAADPAKDILTIALEYGYSTHESFMRAFKQVWNCKPSEYREGRYFELYPRLEVAYEEGDEYMRSRKHVDISELYELFLERKDCYFICCDIKSLIPINQISRKAGDLAIIESMRRMDAVAGEEDVVFRIGGDEFVLLTNSAELSYARQIQEQILKFNGQTIEFENEQIPLSLYVGIVKPNLSHLRYSELFAQLHRGLLDSKAEER